MVSTSAWAAGNCASVARFMPPHLCTSRPHGLGHLPSFPVGPTHPWRSRAAAESFSKRFLSLPSPSPQHPSFLPLCSQSALKPLHSLYSGFSQGASPSLWVAESLEGGDRVQLRPRVRRLPKDQNVPVVLRATVPFPLFRTLPSTVLVE